jgi:hypothetical protein
VLAAATPVVDSAAVTMHAPASKQDNDLITIPFDSGLRELWWSLLTPR